MKRIARSVRLRTLVLVAAAVVALVSIARGPSLAWAQMGDDRPIVIMNDSERHLFAKLRCMCGGCARLDLVTCTCSYAADRREEIRAELKSGMTADEVVAAYVKKFGTDALEVPSNEGANRLVYLIPIVLVLAGAVMLVLLLLHLRRGLPAGNSAPTRKAVDGKKRDDYDDRLDDELKRLDDE